jgi:hypothetical protein
MPVAKSVLIGPARLDFHAARHRSLAAPAVLVAVYPVVLALAPAHRMMDRVPDLMGLQGMLAHVVRLGSQDLCRTAAEN